MAEYWHLTRRAAARHRPIPRQQHDCHTSSGDTGLDGDVSNVANPVSAPPITDGRPVLGHEHAGVGCVIEGSRKDPRVEDVTAGSGARR